MTLTGMNTQDVRQLADSLRRASDDLSRLVSTVDGHVNAVHWVGHDADMFKHEWWPQHRQGLLAAAAAVHGLAQSATNNVTAQEKVSAATGAGSTGGASPGVHHAAPSMGTPAQPLASSAESAEAKTSIDWATNQMQNDPTGWYKKCLGFVAQSWAAAGNNSLFNYDDPNVFVAAHQEELQKGWPPPPGAAVFYTDSVDGHVELSTGNGWAISTPSSGDMTKVHPEDLAYRNSHLPPGVTYQGWLAI